MRDVIWQDASGLEIVASDQADAPFLSQLASVPFGNDGSAYWRLNVEAQLRRFEQPTFLSLRDGEQIIGSYVLDQQRLLLDSRPVTGIYRGLLTIDPQRRHAGLGRELVAQALRWMQSQGDASGQPALSYGVVDSVNHRSLNLLSTLGMQRIGGLVSVLRYRQWRGRRIEGAELATRLTDAGLDAWHAQYGSHGLRSADPSYGNWLTLSDERGRVAACRHHVTELRLAPMGGIAGFVIDTLMPLFPPGRRRFDPRRFRYVSISDPVVPAGSEALWRQLLPHLMRMHDTHFARFTLDPDDATVGRLLRAGAIDRGAWRRRTPLTVMAGNHGGLRRVAPTRVCVSARDL